MLQLINEERVRAGLNPVDLGDNVAAQVHAEASLEECFSSHWGIDGLKPYMRYSLAGGYQSNGENGSGLDYCITASDGYRPHNSIRGAIKETMNGWMDSPGHRDNILNPLHKKVNIGLDWDRYNLMAYQHFEGDYVAYDQMPVIKNGVLSLSGAVKNGAKLTASRDLSVQIYYDTSPQPLTRGQVSRTYCYDSGLPIASLREPLSGGWFYDDDAYTTSYKPCPDPYDVPADARAARSHDEAHQIWREAYVASQNPQEQVIVPWITASAWTVGSTFTVKADLGDLLDRYGPGVYSVMVWGAIGRERAVISEYSIFHDITPPDTYTGRG